MRINKQLVHLSNRTAMYWHDMPDFNPEAKFTGPQVAQLVMEFLGYEPPGIPSRSEQVPRQPMGTTSTVPGKSLALSLNLGPDYTECAPEIRLVWPWLRQSYTRRWGSKLRWPTPKDPLSIDIEFHPSGWWEDDSSAIVRYSLDHLIKEELALKDEGVSAEEGARLKETGLALRQLADDIDKWIDKNLRR